ncbi:putative methyltransferase-domain-containing protein [Lineolata rhizophorae]|uniref:25S rRNA adenine-N(1) methyltransferase n=1 Tax=Lineolata rhizophorae TaxID=578093 RepID=A0A6A6NZG8_9PEZI|nr:putative methyltransferase-domain-containing protein [Lineolata rhizophorae]
MPRPKPPRKPLSHTRPPRFGPPPATGSPTLSSKHARRLIRAHHALHKARARALAAATTTVADADADAAAAVADLDARIARAGGLPRYQLASRQGQARERGGDASRVLVGWVAGVEEERRRGRRGGKSRSLLEVGALSVANACGRVRGLAVTRIDLNALEGGIERQDFMARPLPAPGPAGDADRFDVVSLSLVLNYVPDPVGRGDMLRRTCLFLRRCAGESDGRGGDGGTEADAEGDGERRLFPSLFLVLPAPCVTNSRYLTEEHLEKIMGSLGFRLARRKLSSKLVYYLWVYDGSSKSGKEARFGKSELRKGSNRNNFCIVLK